LDEMLLILATAAVATTTTSQIWGWKVDPEPGQGTTERWLCWYGTLMGAQTKRRIEACDMLDDPDTMAFSMMHKPEMY
jgi:hypothetical protein